jgi:hypothetical protein
MANDNDWEDVPESDQWEDVPNPPQRLPYSEVASAALGAGQGATFSHLPQAGGAISALGSLYTGFSDPSKAYSDTSQKLKQASYDASQDNPKSYFGGNVGGGLAAQAIPGLGIARNSKYLMAALKAAAQGGLTGEGDSEASLTSNPSQYAQDIGTGALIGGGAQLGFGALGAAANKLTPTELKKLAEQRAVKAATGQNIAALRKAANMTGPGATDLAKAEANIQRMGRDILDEGVLAPFDTVSDLAPKLTGAKNKYGQQIGEIGETMDRVAPNSVNTNDIAVKMFGYGDSIPPTEIGKRQASRISQDAENMVRMGGMSGIGFGEAQKLKNQFKYKPTDADALISNQDVSNKLRGIIGGEMDQATKRVAESGSDETKDLLKKYQEAKSKYGSFKGSSTAASDRAIKDLSNRFISPSDYAVGGAAGLSGAFSGDDDKSKTFMTAVAGALANKFARTRGSSLAAVTADNIASVLEKSPTFAKQFGQTVIEAMQRGPAALTTAHYLLMKNPQYRQEFENANTEPQEAK